MILDWVVVVLAGASLIFAGIAYRAVMRTTGKVEGFLNRVPPTFGEDLKALISSPKYLGDALRHALLANEGEVMQVAAEHANGLVYDNLEPATKLLAKEAVSALSVMTTPGQAKALRAKSGAAQGYIDLGGSIQRQALKTGVQDMGTGMLGGLLDHPTYGPIISQVIQQKLMGLMAPQDGGNGPALPGGPGPGPAGPKQPQSHWRPPV